MTRKKFLSSHNKVHLAFDLTRWLLPFSKTSLNFPHIVHHHHHHHYHHQLSSAFHAAHRLDVFPQSTSSNSFSPMPTLSLRLLRLHFISLKSTKYRYVLLDFCCYRHSYLRIDTQSLRHIFYFVNYRQICRKLEMLLKQNLTNIGKIPMSGKVCFQHMMFSAIA